jgi:hypothetical protein
MSNGITIIPTPKGFCGWNYSIRFSDHTESRVLHAEDGGFNWKWTDGTLTIETAKNPARLLPGLQQRNPWRTITTHGALVGDVVWELVEYIEDTTWTMDEAPMAILERKFGAKGSFSKLKLKRWLESVTTPPDANGVSSNMWEIFKGAMTTSQYEDFMLAQNLQIDDPGFRVMFPNIRTMLKTIGMSDTQILSLLVDISL